MIQNRRFQKLRFIILALFSFGILVACDSLTDAEFETLAKPDVSYYDEEIVNIFRCDNDNFGFRVIARFSVSGNIKTFYDRQGNPIRLKVHERFEGSFTNFRTGYTLTDGPGTYNVFIDLRNGSESIRGLFFYLRDADGKRVAIDVGNITFYADGSVKVAGSHDVYENGLCGYLNN